MNVYDFDGTLYDGESTLDFYLYCVKRHPKAIKYVFIVLWSFVKYKLCLVSENELMLLAKRYICGFLECCPDAQDLAESFCNENIKKIKPFYFKLQKADDIIVSASFGFLLRPFFKRMGIGNYLTSEVDFENNEVLRLCYRKNKVSLFNQFFCNCQVEDVYTDSMNDKPLMSLAGRNVYIVKGNVVKKYDTNND